MEHACALYCVNITFTLSGAPHSSPFWGVGPAPPKTQVPPTPLAAGHLFEAALVGGLALLRCWQWNWQF
jgi:hypothetical protein